MELKTYFAQDASGNIMPGATVMVYEAATTTLATGLQDESGAPLANPFTADSSAKVAFYAPDGLYDITVVGNGRTVTIRAQFVSVDGASVLRSDLAATGGAALVGFQQAGTGAVAATAQIKLRETVSVKDFGAVGDGVTDDTAAMNAAAAAAGTAKKALFVPSGVYKMTAPWVIPIKVHVIGESMSIQDSYDPGPEWNYGAVIYKAHTGGAVQKIGAAHYDEGAPIENITVSSHRTTYPGGAGFVLDQCSNVHLIRCNVFGVGGDAFVLGVTAGDVTGHNYVYNCYSNNPAGKHYSIRQKWGRYRDIVCDGGTWGAYLTDAPDSDLTGFHFEGFTVGAIKLAGANTSTRIYHGFVGTTAGATKGIEADAVPGNQSFLFSAIKMQGSSVAGSKAIALAANSVDSIVVGCEFNQWATGVENLAWYANTQTIIRDNEFVGCGVCIVSNAQNTVYQGNSFNDTTGAYDINHLGGSLGLWSGNTFSKGINPGVTGVAGNFSGVRVKDNAGYITRKRGVTAASPAYTNIAHGLAGVPDMPIGLSCLSSGVTSVPQIALRNGTNFQLYWTGTANVQWAWEAALPCDY